MISPEEASVLLTFGIDVSKRMYADCKCHQGHVHGRQRVKRA